MQVIRASNRLGATTGENRSSIRDLAGSVGSLFDSLVARMRKRRPSHAGSGHEMLAGGKAGIAQLELIAHKILSENAHAVGTILATSFIDLYARLESADRLAALHMLASEFGPDRERVKRASAAYLDAPGDETLGELSRSTEPPRQELFRRINQAPFATLALVRLREDLLRFLPGHPVLKTVDDDLVHLFHSWFNRGFLIMKPIDWNSPAQLLDKIIAYEAVHSIGSWDELRRRLAPEDRRCYAFFHPALLDEPLIFVEIALSDRIESSIAAILSEDRQPIGLSAADTAMFYSISNCQSGLQGVSFGHHLLQQVVEDLSRDLPGLQRFVTLSPVPGFARWLKTLQANGDQDAEALLAQAAAGTPPDDDALTGPALRYLVEAKDRKGRAIDPVMRFHLGNGARLERLCLKGDLSQAGLAQSLGLMVNYRYELGALEANRARFLGGEIPLGEDVEKLVAAKADKRTSKKDR